MNAANAVSTRGLSREEWLARRRGTIGASDMASVCGLGYSTPNQAADVISGKVEPEDLSENDAVQIGILTEPANHALYERKTGRRIHRINEMRYHRDLPFIHANLDRVAYGVKRIVELKNTSEWNARSTYERNDVEDATEALPPAVLIQVQTQLAVYNYPIADVSVIIGGNRHRVFEVERDEQMIANILQIATAFYERMQRGELQPITTYEEASRIFPQHIESPIAATLQIAEACNEFRELKGAEKRLSDQIKTLQSLLAAYLGEHDTLLVDGKPALTWRTQPSTRLDNEALKTERPDIYAQYSRSATSRVMRLKKAA